MAGPRLRDSAVERRLLAVSERLWEIERRKIAVDNRQDDIDRLAFETIATMVDMQVRTAETVIPVSHPFLGESLFLIFSSGVIRNGLPSIKIRMMEKFQNKISPTGCTWPNLNAPSTETPESHPFFGESLFLIFLTEVSLCCL